MRKVWTSLFLLAGVCLLTAGCIPVPPGGGGGGGTGGTSTIQSSGSVVDYQAAPHINNSVIVYRGYFYNPATNRPINGPWVYIQEKDNSQLSAGYPCKQAVDNGVTNMQKIYCPPDTTVNIHLNDGGDTGEVGQGDHCFDTGEPYCWPTAPVNIFGGDGDDHLIGGHAGDSLHGDAGNDILEGGDGSEHLYGDAGTDTLAGGPGNDYLDGGPDNGDIVRGEGGADVIECGTGIGDWASYSDSPGAVNVTLGTSNNGGSDAAGDEVHSSCENLGGTGKSDRLTGDGNANEIHGEAGGDTIKGMGGNDRLFGSADNDTISGGPGGDTISCGDGASDWASYTDSQYPVDVTLDGSRAGSGGDADQDVISNCENLDGSAGKDTLTGNDSANILKAEGGGGALWGARGDDTLIGGSGDDAMNGGPDKDSLQCGSGHDWASYFNSPGPVYVTIGGTSSWNDAGGDDVYNDCEQVDGSNYDDVIIGNSSDNVLKGFDGKDTIYGMGGADTIEGGNQNDTIVTAGDSYNGAHDTVDCGNDTDNISVDKDDLTNCETVNGENNDPLILIHGFYPYGEVISGGHDCAAHWDQLRSELAKRGYKGGISTVGYYNGDTNCSMKIDQPGDNNTSIEDLSYRIAWKIWSSYGSTPVNIAGHSMGGMIGRRIMLEILAGNSTYPKLVIKNLVTIQSPLDGSTYTQNHLIQGLLCTSVQCNELLPTSAFVKWFHDNDWRGTGSTDVTEIGSTYDDAVTPWASQVTFAAQHRVIYGTGPNYLHHGSYTDPSTAFDLGVFYMDSAPDGSTTSYQAWTKAPHGITWIYRALTSKQW